MEAHDGGGGEGAPISGEGETPSTGAWLGCPAAGTVRYMHLLVPPWGSKPKLTEVCKSSVHRGLVCINFSLRYSLLRHHLSQFLRCFCINVCTHICSSVCVCTHARACTPTGTCKHDGQKAVYRIWFSLSTVWVPRIKSGNLPWHQVSLPVSHPGAQFLTFGALEFSARDCCLIGFIWALN